MNIQQDTSTLTTSSSSSKPTFLGMDKLEFMVVLMLLFALGAVLNGLTLAFTVWQNGNRIAENRQLALESLQHNCAQRKFAQEQVEASANFLAEHSGDLVIGDVKVSRKQLVEQLNQRRAFRNTYNSLDCRQFAGAGPS